MITISVNDEFIDISDSTNFSLEGDSPFITPGEIPGVKVYNIKALLTAKNQRIFNFSERLNNIERGKTFNNVKIYFYNLQWKLGSFKLRDASNDGYNFSFHTDAGDIQLKIKNRSLNTLPLGSAAKDFNTTDYYPNANHAFIKVKNPLFFDPDVRPDYSGYLNESATSTLTPYVFMLHILDAIFKDVGYYGMEGDWLQDDFIRRVLVYNNYDLNNASSIDYNKHVPDVGIGSFLIDVALSFGITYKIDPVAKKVKIVKIKDWLKEQGYIDYAEKVGRKYKLEPNEFDGLSFIMKDDGDDESMDPIPSWLTYQIGNAQEQIKTEASPLDVVEENGEEIPHIEQEGRGENDELDPEPASNLRFVLFTGEGQGHYQMPGFSLRWQGQDGIISRCYQEWIEWKQYTELVEREVNLSIIELLQLDTQKKIMMDNLKHVISNFKGTINFKNGIKNTKIKAYTTKL